MTYKITIERTFSEYKTMGKEWKILRTKEDGEDERGYTPEIDKLVEITKEVYIQDVDALDLVAVINAVNKPMTVAAK